jgi:branched-chain amino acid transport system substrate-binding protein
MMEYAMIKLRLVMLLGLTFTICLCSFAYAGDQIKIGFNIPLTGSFELVGQHSKNAAELVLKDLKASGGLQVGNKMYEVVFVYGDNKSNKSDASRLALEQVSREQVLGIIGPLSSQQSVVVGQLANAFATPMISPWSTSPLTTLNRPYIFRSCFVFTIQGPVITKFVTKELKAKKAAVLYDIISNYPRGMANSFKEAFNAENGEGAVVRFEEFRTGDTDFRKQLQSIKESDAEFIFSPQHYNEIPMIVRQAKEIGLSIPIIGSNSWAGGDLLGSCGEDCDGLFFTCNYVAGGAKGLNKQFVDAYVDAYGDLPDEPAALTWDAVRVMLKAIQQTGALGGNILHDRNAIKDAITNLQNFEGATGNMSFNSTGNPEKCAVVAKIDDGVFTSYDTVCP